MFANRGEIGYIGEAKKAGDKGPKSDQEEF